MDRARLGYTNWILKTAATNPWLRTRSPRSTACYASPERATSSARSFLPDYPELRFIDVENPAAILYSGLVKAFGGDQLRITSESDDGTRLVIGRSNDRRPFDYFLFDKEKQHSASARVDLSVDRPADHVSPGGVFG